MRVLFLTIGQMPDFRTPSVHIDVVRELKKRGHEVCVLCTWEKRFGKDTEFVVEDGIKVLRLKIGNLTRCSLIEKGINTVLLENQFKRAINKYFGKEKIDLVIYNTPPITLAGAVKYAKKKFGCKSYLMLKDIFPQNAVDLGLMTTSGIRGLIYKIFRRKEISLYKASDRIGCMSEGNIRYLLDNNDYINPEKVELFPNAVFSESVSVSKDKTRDRDLLTKYGIDNTKTVFIYGGNLGIPQGLGFLERALKFVVDKTDCVFVIAGGGAEKEKFYSRMKDVKNVVLLNYLPYEEYEILCASCDVGMVFLDYRFTIPNYPSRILSYLENSMPVLACTDKNTDVKELVEEQAECGKWCFSNDEEDFLKTVQWFLDNKNNLKIMGENGRRYLERYFVTDKNIEKLEKFVNSKENL